MIPLSHLFDFYSKRHYEFQLGWGLVGQLSALITFETFAMVFCDKFGIKGIPSLILYVGAPISAVIMVTFLGHKMIRSGYATKYQQYGMNVNTDWSDTVKNARDTVETVRDILDKVDAFHKKQRMKKSWRTENEFP